MAKQFKTYDGTIIEMPSHTHSVSDTVNAQGSIAMLHEQQMDLCPKQTKQL